MKSGVFFLAFLSITVLASGEEIVVHTRSVETTPSVTHQLVGHHPSTGHHLNSGVNGFYPTMTHVPTTSALPGSFPGWGGHARNGRHATVPADGRRNEWFRNDGSHADDAANGLGIHAIDDDADGHGWDGIATGRHGACHCQRDAPFDRYAIDCSRASCFRSYPDAVNLDHGTGNGCLVSGFSRNDRASIRQHVCRHSCRTKAVSYT